jgi:hypothetical protein
MAKRTVGDLLDERQEQTVIIRRTVKGAMSFDAENCSADDVILLIEWARIMVRCTAILTPLGEKAGQNEHIPTC